MNYQAAVGCSRCAGEDSRKARTMSSSLSPGIWTEVEPEQCDFPLVRYAPLRTVSDLNVELMPRNVDR